MRKLTLLVVVAIAVLAVAAPVASGEVIEVVDPGDQTHCPALSFNGDTVSGGCEAHLVSTGPIFGGEAAIGIWLGGGPIQYDTCNMEAILRMDEDGNAAITDVVFSSAFCDPYAEECSSANAHWNPPLNQEVPWRSVEAASETDTDTVSLPMGVCFDNLFDCEGITTFEIDTSSTPYTLSTTNAGFTGAQSGCYLEGEWTLEGEPFTIRHLD